MKVFKYFGVSPEMQGIEGPQVLWQIIDVNDALHFELFWDGFSWVDVPGEFFENAIINQVPGFQTWEKAPLEWTEGFFPEALKPRFSSKQQAAVETMLTMPLLQRAEYLATQVHQLQVDKAGVAYINHPRRVCENLQFFSQFDTLSEEDKVNVKAAAWLHDVLEDSGDAAWPVTFPSDLAEWGFNREIIGMVELLTKESTFMKFQGQKCDIGEYYSLIQEDQLARLVKLADIADNSNRQRNFWLEQKGVPNKLDRYRQGLAVFDLTQEERFQFESRIALPCELDGMNEEVFYQFHAFETSEGEFSKLYCISDMFDQWEYVAQSHGWVKTMRVSDEVFRGGHSIMPISLADAKKYFPDAFPLEPAVNTEKTEKE